MQMQKVFNLTKYVAMLLLMFHHVENVADHSPGDNMTLTQAIDMQLERDDLHNHLLKRKRRYLEFPSGSSFQLVYDLIVGVVDYTNYLILGVTVALAWELPSKPPSEILSDLKDRLKDGTLGNTRNDSITNIHYVDTKLSKGANNNIRNHFAPFQHIFRPPMHLQYLVQRKPDQYYRQQSQQSAISNRKSWRHNKHNGHSLKPVQPFGTWSKNSRKFPATSSAAKYPWWNLKARLPSFSTKQRQPIQGSRRFDKHVASLKRNKKYKATGRAEHRIFPIFGKRSTPNDSGNRQKRNAYTKWDRIHIRHHRSTRYDLYERIETFLNGRGSNGHHCVLRALCETGQKPETAIPGSFVGEIMRAIFTLPETMDEHNDSKASNLRHRRFEAAYALTGDCATRYHLCKDSLWSSHFVM